MRKVPLEILFSCLCGATVFLLLNLIAWKHHRGEMYVCKNQGYTVIKLRRLDGKVQEFHKLQNRFPANLNELETTEDLLSDEWGRPFEFESRDDGYEIFSLGKDGSRGGIGLDADLYHDRRNQEVRLPTLAQFFMETDENEVDASGFQRAGLYAGSMIALMIFVSLRKLPKDHRILTWVALFQALGFVVLAVVIGSVMLPLHIPSGH
ncbi:type II secretion system protein GspG [Lacunimicrobium album]